MSLHQNRDERSQGTEGLGAVERDILHAIRSIRYGAVEIIIHDSRVVQIERKEKVRFDLNEGEKRR
ncbi:MAG: YezD family protein [Planctomycetes bacterium]|nr:YezD family protein [Planctomycetota bacterium]